MFVPASPAKPGGQPIALDQDQPMPQVGENLKIVAIGAWEIIAKTKSIPGKAFKATAVLTTTLIMTAASISIAALAILFHLVAFPFMVQAWNAKDILNHLRSDFKEVISLSLSVLTFPLHGTWFDPPTPAPVGSKPILLVHGYLHNSSAWHNMRQNLEKIQLLEKQGYGPIYTVDLGHPFHSIEEYAEKVRKRVKEIGCSDLILVGHSMGGLVSAEYATTHAQEDGIKTSVITLGSPLDGTKFATIGIGRCAQQMKHNSEYIKDLQARIKRATNVRFYHIGSRTDLVIRPIRSALMLRRGVNNFEFESCGHITYLYSEVVAKKVAECCRCILERRAPSPRTGA